jgi:hypothetical protein
MAKHQEGISLIPTRFQHAEIPITVATLIIDGKRLTSAFYKQITEAALIDEGTGALRGEPLGYFHLHSKACPEVPHTHVLWATETELHLASVVSPEQDERYQQQEQASRERRNHLIHLLALLLGLADHSLTSEYENERRRKLVIAGYTLYADKHIADQLQRLQQAREQWKQDQRAWQGQEESEAFGQHQRIEAEALLAGFDQRGVELKHPARDKIERSELAIYGLYGDDDDALLFGPKTWCRYPASSEGDSHEEPLLSWRAKDRQQRNRQKEHLSPVVDALLAERNVLLLRLLLAERMAHNQIRAIRDEADELARSADIAALLQPKPSSLKAGKKKAQPFSSADLDPDQVWRSYQEESYRFESLAQQWKAQVKQLSVLRQLFLLS